MKFEKFSSIIQSIEERSNTYASLNSLGVNLNEFSDPYYVIISDLIEEIYGIYGLDWFNWFCYDNNFGKANLVANDSDGNRIAYSIQSLWELLEGEYKESINLNNINRVEYVGVDGRDLVAHGKHSFSIQDDEKTLKIFKIGKV